MSFADRQKKLQIIQQVYADWAQDNPPVNDEYLASDDQEADLIIQINKAIAQAEDVLGKTE